MRPPHLRGRGPNYPILDRIEQYPFEPGYVVFTMPCPKRLRVVAGGEVVADTTEALILFESDHLPIYYFPLEAIHMDRFEPSPLTTRCRFKGEARHYSLKGAGPRGESILWRYEDPVPGCPPIGEHASFYWHEVDRWIEEDEEVFVHARDPYRRVDCLRSSRRVTVEVGGRVVADTTRAVFLFETGLPPRHYLPPEDMATGLLEPSPQVTRCPYKGVASYHHLRLGETLHENLVWTYREPLPEVAAVAGLHCLGQEFVDRLSIDGTAQPRPATAWSHGHNYTGHRQR